jgi:uncharacterized repeat protein (TIGR02543 family)
MRRHIFLFLTLFVFQAAILTPDCLAGTTPPVNGLVAWYPFNGDALDASGNGNNGTVNGATLSSDHNGILPNRAYYFDGTVPANGYGPHIAIPDNSGFHFTNKFTLSTWVMPMTTSGVQSIVDKAYVPDAWSLLIQDGYYKFVTVFPGGTWGIPLDVTAPATANVWTHVAAVYDGSQMILYLNGVNVASKSASGNIQDSGMPVYIGNHPAWNAFKGIIDDVHIYNIALTLSEIQALYNETTYNLTLNKTGSGTGTVTSDIGLIRWSGTTGRADFISSTIVTLTANQSNGSTFAGWSGACSGPGICKIPMNEAKSVTATFGLLDAVCGIANGQFFSKAPKTNLCASGTVADFPNGDGPWTWTCNGSDGGNNSTNCTANLFTVSGGPININYSIWQSIGPFGGDTSLIAIDPLNSQTLFATFSSKLFKSKNGGASWSESSAGMETYSIQALAIDPSNTEIIYAGTYGGVFKSIDGGTSWTTSSIGMSNDVKALVIDSSNTQIIYAGTDDGVFKSINAGGSWSSASAGIPANYVLSLAIDHVSPQSIYAGTQFYGVYKSIDGGNNWNPSNNGIDISMPEVRSIVIDPSNNRRIYAASYPGGVFKSINGGDLWTETNNGWPNGSSIQLTSLAIDPIENNKIYMGTNIGGGLFKTIDGGNWWNSSISGLTINSIAVDKTNAQTVYLGTNRGIIKSVNGGVSWMTIDYGISGNAIDKLIIDNDMNIYASGINLLKSSSIDSKWKTLGTTVKSLTQCNIDNTLYSAASNGIYKSISGGESWSLVNSVMTYANNLAIDPRNCQKIYTGTLNRGVLKSTDGGLSWVDMSIGLTYSGVAKYPVQAIAIDPLDGKTIYVGAGYPGGVYKFAVDGDNVWTAINDGLTYSSNNIIYKRAITSLAIDPINSKTIYAGTSIGVFKTTDGGTNWKSASMGLAERQITSLAIDPIFSQTVYAGTYVDGIFRSTDGGKSWVEFNNGLTNKKIKSLVIDPTNTSTIYAGTSTGVFKTLFSNTFPVITNETFTTFYEKSRGNFRLHAAGWPTPYFNILSGTLPKGLSFDSKYGIISGTPDSGTTGTYPLLVGATNGTPPDAVRGITLTVLPASDLAVIIDSPVKGSGMPSLAAISGTADGIGLSAVELQITDGSYYLKSNPDGSYSFDLTHTWLTASGTSAWTLDTSAIVWREGVTYTISARASDGNTTSVQTSSTFTIQVPTIKSATILSMSFTSDTILAGNSVTISGSLVKSDSTAAGQSVTLLITPPPNATNLPPITVTTDSNGTFTTGTLSQFTTPGVYLVQARFEGTSELASSFASQAFGVTEQSGYAIIVSGKTTDDNLLTQHTASTDTIKSILVDKRGFLPDNIRYLKSETGNPVTKQQIYDAIIWARDKLKTAPAPLYLIMIDHGSQTVGNQVGGFMLDKETLTPDRQLVNGQLVDGLKEYLDTLETDPDVVASGALSTYKRIIIIGACYSGAFASKLSKEGRIVITSSTADEQSIAGFTIYNSGSAKTFYGGEYFIDSLFTYLGKGDSMKDAFVSARDMVKLRDTRAATPDIHAGVFDTLAQHPLLDDNGDGKPSYFLDTDGAIAANLYLGVGKRTLGNPADITAVTDTATIPPAQTSAPLWLRVNDNSRIAKAWVEIRTPNIDPPTNGGTGQFEPGLGMEPLYYDGLQWNGSYTFLDTKPEGTYIILYYTQDNQTGDIAPAKSSTVYKEKNGNIKPESFTLLTPHDGYAVVSDLFPLTWQNVTATPPNNITYTLQVATDDTFNNVIYKAENILYPITYLWKEALKNPVTNRYYCATGDGYCYWKVQTIDSFGAIQETVPWKFTISDTGGLPYYLKGQVLSTTTGLPLSKVNIKVSRSGDSFSQTDDTKDDGSYSINLGFPGDFTITLAESYPGYQKRSDSLSLTSSGITTKNYTLTPATQGTTSHTVSFDSNGGSAVTSQSIAYNNTATTPTTPTRTGYTFAAWYSDSALTSAFAFTTALTADTTLYAKWTINSYTVTFTSGGNGSLSGITIQTINYGSSATAVTAVPATDYHFVNWTGDNGFIATSANPLLINSVTASQSITANFSINPVNGLCGSSNGQAQGTAPTTNLCTTGTASTVTGAAQWNWTCNGTNGGTNASCSANQSIQTTLKAGWNLMGWATNVGYYQGTAPLSTEHASSATMSSNTMSTVFSTMGLSSTDSFVVVGPDGVVYMPGSPFNTLKKALPGKAYWIYTPSDKTITVPGTALLPTDQLPLNSGWTQIAYWGTDGVAPANGFNCINGKYDILVDETGKVYMSGSPFNTLKTLQKNKGYFIHTTAPATLVYQCP